jgi:hypothetical protein
MGPYRYPVVHMYGNAGRVIDCTYSAVVAPIVVARKLEQWPSKSLFTESAAISTARTHRSSQKLCLSRRKRLPTANGRRECHAGLVALLEALDGRSCPEVTMKMASVKRIRPRLRGANIFLYRYSNCEQINDFQIKFACSRR